MLKNFLLWNGRFEEGGWGLKKKLPLAVLRDKGGNGRCPLPLKMPYSTRFDPALDSAPDSF